MKTVIYLDVLLLTNFLIAFLMLGAVSLWVRQPLRFGRALAGAILGALASLTILLPPMPLPIQLLVQLAGCGGMVAAAFGWQSAPAFCRRAALLWAFNLVLAGVTILCCMKQALPGVHTNNLQVYLYLSPQGLVALSLLVYGGGWLAKRLRGNPGQSLELELELELLGERVPVRGMLDTGFALRDDLGSRPVILVQLEALEGRISPKTVLALARWLEGRGMITLPGLRLLPCTTVSGQGLLPAFPALARAKGRELSVLAAVTSQPIRLGREAEAIFGWELAQLLQE